MSHGKIPALTYRCSTVTVNLNINSPFVNKADSQDRQKHTVSKNVTSKHRMGTTSPSSIVSPTTPKIKYVKPTPAATSTSAHVASPGTQYMCPATTVRSERTRVNFDTTTRNSQSQRGNSEQPPATPIKPDRLLYHLNAIKYNEKIKNKLYNGFSKGFFLDHVGEAVSTKPSNSRSTVEHADVVRQKLAAEVEAGRISGPHKEPPFDPFQISPLNVRPKKQTEEEKQLDKRRHRLLHNLSHPYDDTAVNACIPESSKRVTYASTTDAMRLIMKLPKQSYTAKTDIADAYRIIPLHASEHPKLGMYFEGNYYYDRNLPQGCGSSCRIFEEFATALEAIFKFYHPEANVCHLLDDFFFAAASYDECKRDLANFKALCDDIGVPLHPDKTTDPAMDTEFLGIELDTAEWIARLPMDKVEPYAECVETTLQHKRVTRKHLESLLGKLSFAATVVPARPFLRRLFNLLDVVQKPYHYIRLTKAARSDLLTWLEFLQQHNGMTYFRCLKMVSSSAINLGADASKAGLGACYGSQWIQAQYPPHWSKLHISVLEFFPIFVLISMFGHLMRNSCVVFHCDNEGVVAIINKQSSKDPTIMSFVRPLVLLLIKFNIQLTSRHVPGVSNVLCDRISRFQETPSLLQQYGMRAQRTEIPHPLQPLNYSL